MPPVVGRLLVIKLIFLWLTLLSSKRVAIDSCVTSDSLLGTVMIRLEKSEIEFTSLLAFPPEKFNLAG